MRTRGLRTVVAVVALGAVAAGCSSSVSPGTGQMQVVMTDSPIADVQSATVWVSRVYLIGGSDSGGTRYTITSTPASYDLLSLQGGVTAALGTVTIPTGSYSQLRFVVDSARITLAGGLTFPGGSASATLTVPSGMQTGIKVTFDSPVQVTPGQTVLVADFDVSRSFVLTGPPTAPTGAIFKPVIHATAENVAASIAGTVTPASAHAKLYAIFSTSGDTVATALADTTTGVYKLWYLAPGAYTVTAVGAGLNASKTLTLRDNEDTTGVNFP
jgi:Domain of unknown function (DUF4382)